MSRRYLLGTILVLQSVAFRPDSYSERVRPHTQTDFVENGRDAAFCRPFRRLAARRSMAAKGSLGDNGSQTTPRSRSGTVARTPDSKKTGDAGQWEQRRRRFFENTERSRQRRRGQGRGQDQSLWPPSLSAGAADPKSLSPRRTGSRRDLQVRSLEEAPKADKVRRPAGASFPRQMRTFCLTLFPMYVLCLISWVGDE